jgi:hypothetical protein
LIVFRRIVDANPIIDFRGTLSKEDIHIFALDVTILVRINHIAITIGMRSGYWTGVTASVSSLAEKTVMLICIAFSQWFPALHKEKDVAWVQ